MLNSEGLDDPEKYVNWLMAKASAGELRNTSFGAAISTSDDEMVQLNARELGLDIDTRLIKDQLERDLAIIEANGMAILRRMGLYLSDEGHGADGDRVLSAWISVDGEDKARTLAATVLSLARDQHNEPARTSSGTLNSLSPEADRLIYQNVSDWGQRLIDVSIYFFDTERIAEWASAAGADIGESTAVNESTDPDDPEMFIKQFLPAWRLLSHIRNNHFYFIDDFQRVAVADYSMGNQSNPASAEDGLLLLLKEKPITKFKLHRLGDFHYSIPVRQDRTGKEMSISANTTEFTDLWPKLEPLGFTLRLKEAAEDEPDPQLYVDQLQVNGVSKEQSDAIVQRGFAFSNRYANGGVEWSIQLGRHSIYLIRSGYNTARTVAEIPDIWTLIDYNRGGSQTTGPAGFNVIMTEFDKMVAAYRERAARRLPEDLNDEPSPEYYLQATTGWIDTFLNAGMKHDPTTNMAGRFLKKYELHGYHYNLWINTRNPMWMIAERNDNLYGTNVYRRVFEYPDGDKGGLTTEFAAVDKLLTKATKVLWSTYPTIDEKIGQLHTKHLGRRQKWLSGRIKEAVSVTSEIVDPETFIKDVFCGPVLEALDIDLPPEDEPTGHDIDQTFNVDDILRGYERVRVNNNWFKLIRFEHPLRLDMEIIVRRRGHATEDDADTLYDIDILKSTDDKTGFVHLTTGYSIPLLKLREAVKIAERSVNQGHYGDFERLYGLTRNFQENLPVDIPPEDEPGDVLATHEKGLFLPELKRLGFQQGNDKEAVDLYGEKVPRYWYKTYKAADGKTHAVYTYLIHCLSGGPPGVKFNIYNEDSKQWWPNNKGETELHPQSTAQAAACLRDIDAAMVRSAEMSLPPDQEWASLQRITSHYSKWYWNALYPPGQHVLNVNPG